MDVSWLVLGVMVALSAANMGAIQFEINPKRASTQNNGSTVIMCDIKSPATGCFFHVWYSNYYGRKWDSILRMSFEKGHGTAPFKRPQENDPLFQAKYHGESMQKGHCGVKLFDLKPGTYFVGCRVRTTNSGWTYDYMALVVQNSTGSQTSPTENVNMLDFDMVNVKENETSRPIDFAVNLRNNRECRIFLPEGGLLSPKSEHKSELTDLSHKAKWRVSGSTVSVTLLNVMSGGPLWCLCRDGPNTDYTDFDVKIVTVLKAPKIPEFTDPPTTNFTEGENLTATCFAKYARPVAKIVWKLGDDVIRNNTDDDNVDEPRMDIDPHDRNETYGQWPWRWPWSTKSIKQVVHRVLTLNDSGKHLTCQVWHPALAGGQWNSTNSLIIVNVPKEDSPKEKNANANNSSNFFGTNGFLYAGLAVGVILVAIIVGVVIFYQRRRKVGSPRAGHPTDCTSFIEENDLYQRHNDNRFVNKPGGHSSESASFVQENDLYQVQNDPRFVNRQTSGTRASIQAENPYEELNIIPSDSHPSTTTSNRISPTYGNTVHYAEVTIGTRNDAKPPPRKPVDEACVYAEVMKKNPPKR